MIFECVVFIGLGFIGFLFGYVIYQKNFVKLVVGYVCF